jgi:hypothetical protein
MPLTCGAGGCCIRTLGVLIAQPEERGLAGGGRPVDGDPQRVRSDDGLDCPGQPVKELAAGAFVHNLSPSSCRGAERLAPDGYTLGWNDQGGLHPHLHVIPRFDDEPMADHGVRSGIKDPANRRPDPWRPGTGRHLARS